MYKKSILLFTFILIQGFLLAQDKLNTIERAMKDEMERSMNELTTEEYGAPFFIRYRVNDVQSMTVLASLGALHQSVEAPSRTKEIRVMVGDYDFNDESMDANDIETSPYSFGYTDFTVPLGEDYIGIRRSLWITTDAIYKQAGQIFKGLSEKLEREGKTIDEVDHRWFDQVPKVEYLEEIKTYPFDKQSLEEFAKNASALFLDYDNLFTSTIRINAGVQTTYMINSEGIRYRTSEPFTRIGLTAAMLSQNEQMLYESYTYDLSDGDDLPDIEDVAIRINSLIERINVKDSVDSFDDNYYGPVLFTENTVPLLFNTYVINQLFASTSIANDDDYYYDDGNSLDSRLNKRIISPDLSVTLHTNLEEWDGQKLHGSYKIDSEGVMTPDTLVLIENGVLKNLMSTRTIAREGQKANGTGSGAGVVFVSSAKTTTLENLKKRLIELAKENDQDYSIIVRGNSGFGGLYSTDVYKVDLETGEEVLLPDASVSEIALNKLKRIQGVSSNQIISYIMGNSYVAPDALLLEDIGIRGNRQQLKMKAPLVKSPLRENN